MPLGPRDRLGPYQILAQIGAGAMGEVYSACDDRLQRDVAIKLLPPSFSGDPDRLRRFEQEAQAAGRLNHPNILAIYDIGTHQGSPFIVSELLEGETLQHRLSAGPLPAPTTVDFSTQLAQGLAAAHDNGITHRDLKPANVFVTTDGRVKILDFGLAKLTARPHSHTGDPGDNDSDAPTIAPPTMAGSVVGTVGYMSPEQVRGEPADERSDLFSLGAVMYEMLAGRRAFDRGSPVETMSAILRDEPPDLPERPDVPPALARIMRRCLAKIPGQRFQSARDLALALGDVAIGAGTSVAAGPPARRRFGTAWWVAAAPIAAVALALLVGLVDLRRLMPQPAGGAHVASLAVLPLKNLSNDPEQEYFSDGMTEALIADLAQVGGVRVISRTSAMIYKSSPKLLTQIARELNVDTVVEGSVVRAGDRVRITAQLIDGKTDRHMWANSYERPLQDVLSLQGEVARAITQEIKITLTPREEARLAGVRPVNGDAHEAYLRGRYFLGKGTRQPIEKAIEYFNQAIARDPNYAGPYTGLADAYTLLRSTYRAPHDVMPQAKVAAVTALQLDPALAEAHVSMGGVLMFYDFNWPAAEAELKRAIELSPNLAQAHDYYALYLASVGRKDEAHAEVARAQELDPLSLQVLSDAGWIYYLTGQYERMIDVSRKAVDLDPNFWPGHMTLGLGYEKAGRFADAVASLQTARQLDDNASILEMLAGTYATWGKKDEARKVLADLSEQAARQYVCPYEVATVHATLGDTKSSLEWLEKGYQARADCMPWARSDPKLDVLRGNPQFEDLMRRMGFPKAK